MNLTRRLAHQKDGALGCPFVENVVCRTTEKQSRCAHYNPETDECIHVEAARAQVEAAEALVGIAEWVKQTFDSPLEQKRVITLERSIEPEYEEYCGPWWTCPACGSEFIMGHFLFCPECGRTIEWIGDGDA